MGVEDLGDLVAHEVIHRLHVDLRGQTLLDAVDDRQLGGALVALGQEALGLVEQASVLERDAQARCNRGKQPQVGIGERVQAVQVLQGDPPEDRVPDDEWRKQHGLGWLALERRSVDPTIALPGLHIPDKQGLTSLADDRGHPARDQLRR